MALGHLSPSNSVLPCRYHSINAPYSFLSQYSSYMKDKRVQPGNLTKTTCNSGQTSSCSSVFSVMKQGERACGSTCNKTALCNLYTCASAFTDTCVWRRQGREWVGFTRTNCQFTATQQQVRANCYAAVPGGNKGHYYHVRYNCITTL
jgi:hypothetical protein